MELNNTIEMMQSSDYKERFKAEYFQLVIRYSKLKNMTEKWDNGTLNFAPTCDRCIYDFQLHIMETYIDILKYRAWVEGVKL